MHPRTRAEMFNFIIIISLTHDPSDRRDGTINENLGVIIFKYVLNNYNQELTVTFIVINFHK